MMTLEDHKKVLYLDNDVGFGWDVSKAYLLGRKQWSQRRSPIKPSETTYGEQIRLLLFQQVSTVTFSDGFTILSSGLFQTKVVQNDITRSVTQTHFLFGLDDTNDVLLVDVGFESCHSSQGIHGEHILALNEARRVIDI